MTEQLIKRAREAVEIVRLCRIRKPLLRRNSLSGGCGEICRVRRVVKGDGVTAAILKREGVEMLSYDRMALRISRAKR